MAKPKRWIAAFDSHGDQADPATMRAFWQFLSIWKPDIRVAGGDHFNFDRYMGRATESERYKSGQHDFDCGINFLKKYGPTHLVWGNHDARLWKQLKDPNENRRDEAEKLIEKIKEALAPTCRVEMEYRVERWLEIGDLRIFHGVGAGVGKVREMANIYEKVLIGHLHRFEIVNVPGVKRREGYACGCLAGLWPDYSSTHVSRMAHENGWAYGEVLPSGHTTVHLARRVGGVWHLPTEFRSIA